MIQDKENFLKRVILVILGQLICGIGVGFFMFPGLGPDPNSVFIEGFGLMFGLTYGKASFILNGVIALAIFFMDKRFVNIASIFVLFPVGFVADFTRNILSNGIAIESASYPFKFIFTILGGIILAIGVVIYTNQELGAGAFDAMAEFATFKSKVEYSKVKRILEIGRASCRERV